MTQISDVEFRQNLARYLDEASDARTPITVMRQDGKGNIVMLAETEFAAWQETIYLLSSPRNAERLLEDILQADHISLDTKNDSSAPGDPEKI